MTPDPNQSLSEGATCCRAVVIAAPGSGHGKTVLTAALARRWSRQGQRVQVFKLGPDYLDPTILETASGGPVYNLDRWIMGDAMIRRRLHTAAANHDILLIESLMGLYDHSPSNAEFAKIFGMPVLLVIDVAKLAQTSAAIVKGLMRYDEAVFIQSVIANRVGSMRHAELIEQSLELVTRYAGGLRRDDRLELPMRHLGLVQASDIKTLDAQLSAAADCLDDYAIDVTLASVEFAAESTCQPVEPLLQGKRVAIARDRAFGFVYPANIETLEELGATCVFFSPLADEPLPTCDALWLPGGYPELHLNTLNESTVSMQAISAHINAGKPALAECGGMMVLGREIATLDGSVGDGLGLLDAKFQMHQRFQSIGPIRLATLSGEIRGHAFHHSQIITSIDTQVVVTTQAGLPGASVYQLQSCYASYAHWYFASDPVAVARLFLGQSWVRPCT